MQVVDDLEDAKEQMKNAKNIRILGKTDLFNMSDQIFVCLFRLCLIDRYFRPTASLS